MGIGGVLAGWLADRVGRVRVVWWAVLIFSTFTGVIAWCHTYWQVAVMRSLSGFGIGALYSIGTLLAAEYVPTRVRTTVLGTLQAGWSVGYVIAALLSAYVLPRFGWRPLFACAIVPGVLALALLWRAPDPPSWNATSAQREEPRCGRAALSPCCGAIVPSAARFCSGRRLDRAAVRLLRREHVAAELSGRGISASTSQSMGWYVAGTYTMTMIGKIVTGYLADASDGARCGSWRASSPPPICRS